MYFEDFKSLLYSDTLVSDIFISQYMPSMDSTCVKVYIYMLFLCKHNKKVTSDELAKTLNLSMDEVKSALTSLDNLEVITWVEDKIQLSDLKEAEIQRMYKLKAVSTPEQANANFEKNKSRNNTLAAINSKFFQGLMAPNWYLTIDNWFTIYKFDEDVMYTLFKYCHDNNTFHKSYIEAVATNWHRRGIQNFFDLEKYFEDMAQVRGIKGTIIKKLRLRRALTEYESEYVERWVIDYKYGFDVIELALKKTVGKTNPDFKFLNNVLTRWHDLGLVTAEEILGYENSIKTQPQAGQSTQNAKPKQSQRDNFEQREYDDEYFENFFTNTSK
ncbi:primosome, DnaD subunit [Ruminiclostridium papyrosolvens DSM 2782]|uniref:Primosome, DnaD subunit n=1 Tax=Ruminiclostridium papyrosolvens DSM 2782 TaxID=588581 RepID=F1TCK4_9FIRM|nr:DnaD domain protein [Ruminiclostridium papyrosolvens]EGD47721.1 primosome, DnaD subunit [Ruminiclostridium papyrosolvens DSM 2782]WES34439.1 DnaD domain protein [Ruminiclostridium papyrosolvens DSM 2782]